MSLLDASRSLHAEQHAGLRNSQPTASLIRSGRSSARVHYFRHQKPGRRIQTRLICASITQTSAAYKTFTNPEGTAMRSLTENVWTAERPFIWNGIDVNGRMTVIRLQDGTLWIHSPVDHDATLGKLLAELGTVKHVVSPNYEHVKYAAQWRAAYPEATLYACPGLKAKKPEVGFDRELGQADKAPPEWLGEVECTCLTYERNPFNGKPFFNEAVFLHKPSGFLMVSDLYWNYPSAGTSLGTRAWKFGMDAIYGPFYKAFMIHDREQFGAAKARLLDDWQIQGIIPCHGDIIQSGGRSVLQQHLGQ